MSYTGNYYLPQNERDGNALDITTLFSRLGWTRTSIAGMLGNMHRESGVNPGIWQNLDEGNMSGGFGLVQWTPATNYIDWAIEQGYTTYSEYGELVPQVNRIEYEFNNGLQYYPTSDFPMTASEYKKSSKRADYLAEVFLMNYERAGVAALEERKAWAIYYYNLIIGSPSNPPDFTNPNNPVIPDINTPTTPDPNDPTITTSTKKRKYNFILFGNRRKRMWIDSNL